MTQTLSAHPSAVQRTTRREALIKRLLVAQNAPCHEHVDILTITAFMDDDDVERHVITCEAYASERR
jgi:hypothetical protein